MLSNEILRYFHINIDIAVTPGRLKSMAFLDFWRKYVSILKGYNHVRGSVFVSYHRMSIMFSTKLLSLKDAATAVAAEISPFAAEIDREAMWPARSMTALSKAGLMGLQVPEQFGG